jgi:hypothetical protein
VVARIDPQALARKRMRAAIAVAATPGTQP